MNHYNSHSQLSPNDLQSERRSQEDANQYHRRDRSVYQPQMDGGPRHRLQPSADLNMRGEASNHFERAQQYEAQQYQARAGQQQQDDRMQWETGAWSPGQVQSRGQSHRQADRPYSESQNFVSGPQSYAPNAYGMPPQARDWRGQDHGGSAAQRQYAQGEQQASTANYGSAMLNFDSLANQGPHSGKGPKGYKRSDKQICQDASQRLEDHGQVDASDFEVSCKGGVLTLQGKVTDRSSKRAAESCVEGVRGVNDVMNKLKVDQGLYPSLFGANNDSSSQRKSGENGAHLENGAHQESGKKSSKAQRKDS